MDHDHRDAAGDFYYYSKTSRSVAIVQGTAGVLSCVTAATLFIHLLVVTAYPLIYKRVNGVSAAHDGGENTKLKTQVSLFLMALFASDTFQSFCGMMQIRWAAKGGVELHSAACRLQGVALLAGDLGVCYFNVVMAVHTFMTIVMRKTMSTAGEISVLGLFEGMTNASAAVTTIIIVAGWALAVLFSLLGPFAIATEAKGSFYGLAGLWCFVTDEYSGPRVYLHYLPIYISVFMLLVIYIAVFWKLRMRERTSQRSGTLSTTQRATILNENPNLRVHYNKVANKLLWYPSTYLCLILPISIGRVIQIGGRSLPQPFMSFAITILMLSGFVNGLIYVFTRKALSPFSSWAPQRKADLSFLKKRSETTPTYAVWVTHEQQQNTPGDDKYAESVELSDGIGKHGGKHDPEAGSI
ncbi:family A G protein-coupled receptor-like protein [Auriculariales sp. MPI-PUGE-AT-0066]|nr:family A G protein-coupled receptor-like protein [Auriculariales sp. MPI-PUGE-AT-0066]